MNYSARRKTLRFLETFMVVLSPVALAIRFVYIRAVTEAHSQLRSFIRLVLNKIELVILQAGLARNMAQLYQGKMYTPVHQKNTLNIIRGRLHISELIHVQDDHFLYSTSMAPPVTCIMLAADYKRTLDITIYYYRGTPFFAGYRMTYVQRGNYIAVINLLSCNEVMSDGPDLSWGVYDTVADTFFSASEAVNIAQFAPLIYGEALAFQQDDRFYIIVHSEKRPIATIVSISGDRVSQIFYHEMVLTIPFGVICSILISLMWRRMHQKYLSPRHLLKRTIKKRQLCLYYQPIIDIKDEQRTGAEALLCWSGCKGEVMNPTEFIPLAEKEGMIERITDYAVEETLNDLGYFFSVHPQFSISINLSASDFHLLRLTTLISDENRECSTAARQIKVEVTERGSIGVHKMAPVIQALRKAGYEMVFDDFGTGYSNLYNLSTLNVDILKVGRSFISTLSTNSANHLIVEHTIGMAQSLYSRAIVEGVETKEQIEQLFECGTQYCQDWYFAKVLPPQEFMHQTQRSPAILTQNGQ